ncbi:MAG: anthranilate synthase component I [Nitrospirae bacterium]|nr:anthranilate synthase component I [Nitrospirota bacterium]
MIFPSFDEFSRLSKQGNLIPVYREILADLETPVSAFLKIDDGRFAYLLESIEGGEKWGRYSFLGSRPSLILKGNGDGVRLISSSGEEEKFSDPDPLLTVQRVMARYRPVKVPGLPPFFGGAVGYLGYDLIRRFERLPALREDVLGVPEMILLLTDTLLIFDNLRHRIQVVSNAHTEGKTPEAAYAEAVKKIDALIARLRAPHPPGIREIPAAAMGSRSLESNVSRGDFHKAVTQAQEYIRAGDIFQVVLSQRFSTPVSAEPFDVYRALRGINPSPYMYFLRLGDFSLAGSSPEALVRCEEGVVETHPIAGTRRRGATPEEDRRLEEELRADPKERAEHLMLVDLGRNDVGRVAETGTVTVDELMGVERYSHVMHLVSNVKGKLARDKSVYDVLRACFPAGTVSGAPKIRAMEIIEELEPSRRGPYAGAVGYFSFSGNMDTAINIRTILIKPPTAYIQAGAGIVADSDPDREYEETVNKAAGMVSAIALAEEGPER